MRKVILIDDREVAFDSNAYFAVIFKNQFGYDIMTVVMPLLSEVLKGADEIYRKKDEIQPSLIGELLEHIYSLEMTDLMNYLWSLAKMADESIPLPDVWYREFESFPVVDVVTDLGDMIIGSFISKKKLAALTAKLGIQNLTIPSTSTPSWQEPSAGDSPSET